MLSLGSVFQVFKVHILASVNRCWLQWIEKEQGAWKGKKHGKEGNAGSSCQCHRASVARVL